MKYAATMEMVDLINLLREAGHTDPTSRFGQLLCNIVTETPTQIYNGYTVPHNLLAEDAKRHILLLENRSQEWNKEPESLKVREALLSKLHDFMLKEPTWTVGRIIGYFFYLGGTTSTPWLIYHVGDETLLKGACAPLKPELKPDRFEWPMYFIEDPLHKQQKEEFSKLIWKPDKN